MEEARPVIKYETDTGYKCQKCQARLGMIIDAKIKAIVVQIPNDI